MIVSWITNHKLYFILRILEKEQFVHICVDTQLMRVLWSMAKSPMAECPIPMAE